MGHVQEIQILLKRIVMIMNQQHIINRPWHDSSSYDGHAASAFTVQFNVKSVSRLDLPSDLFT